MCYWSPQFFVATVSFLVQTRKATLSCFKLRSIVVTLKNYTKIAKCLKLKL